MFDNFKQNLFVKKILKNIEENISQRELKNLQYINNIGIVFDATNFKTINQIHDFEINLKKLNKQVEIFGYVNTNDEKVDECLISNKDLNWYGYPRKMSLFDFANKKFDLLMGVYSDPFSPLNTIFSLSKAKLRLGIYNEDNDDLFDVSLSINKVHSTDNIINSFSNFITKVKTN